MTKQFISAITGKEFTIRELTFGEMSMINDEAQYSDPKTLMPMMSTYKRRIVTIQKAVTTPALTEKQIAGMGNAEGLELFNAIMEMHTVPLPASPQPSSDTKE